MAVPKLKRKTNYSLIVILVVIGFVGWLLYFKETRIAALVEHFTAGADLEETFGAKITLPVARSSGGSGLYSAIQSRRSVRDYADKPLNLNQISQLMWSAQGITDKETGYRSAPSAFSAYPLELYLVAIRVTGLTPGIYHYLPGENALQTLKEVPDLSDFYTAGRQDQVKKAPAVMVLSVVMSRSQAKRPESAASDIARSVYQESGHVGQNLYLTAEDLGLGMVVMGGFDSVKMHQVLGLGSNEEIVYIMPVGIKP